MNQTEQMGQIWVKYGSNIGQRRVKPTHVGQMLVKSVVKYELHVPIQRNGSTMDQIWVNYGSNGSMMGQRRVNPTHVGQTFVKVRGQI